ncbi:DUF2945 domain-containing protein [Deinococcus petrolearius]|uniref:DUF2945 domain-containing protein n=1 Tax=Deinococcus petrolearius TaxID=1751295 RepID=A0ABW1DLQ4_9DEIO
MTTFEKGDRVKWSSHGGEAHGEVVRVAHEDGEVQGFRRREPEEGRAAARGPAFFLPQLRPARAGGPAPAGAACSPGTPGR